MAEKDKTYKRRVGGNIVKVVVASIGTLVCCGKPMEIQDDE